MKVAPLHRAFQQYPQVESKILHTGQHYDEKMSDIFVNQVGMPEPAYYLGVGTGSRALLKAKPCVIFSPVFEKILKFEL